MCEASEGPGGRVRTDFVDDFRLTGDPTSSFPGIGRWADRERPDRPRGSSLPVWPRLSKLVTMSAGASHASLYRETRRRLSELVLSRPDAEFEPVRATPGWSVHDVIAHLTGVAEDLHNGSPPRDGALDEWTASHVERGRDTSTATLLDTWARHGPTVDRLLEQTPMWPLVIDVASHEHDIRAALDDTAARDSEVVTACSRALLRSLEVPRPLVVRTEDQRFTVGPEDSGTGVVTLTTTAFEAFRWRMGRRSRGQLAAMDWDGDPVPLLDHLCVFGPAEIDLVE